MYLIGLTLGLVIAGCSVLRPSTSDADLSFLTGEPCLPPCWYGAVPGQTDIQEMHKILNELDFVDSGSVVDFSVIQRGQEVDGIQWACTFSREIWCGRAFFDDDGQLSQLVHVPNYALTVKMAVDRLGAPEFTEYGSYASEIVGCKMYIFWPVPGVIAEHAVKGRTIQCQRLNAGEPVSSDLTILKLIYAAETIFERDPPAMCCVRVAWPGMDQ